MIIFIHNIDSMHKCVWKISGKVCLKQCLSLDARVGCGGGERLRTSVFTALS